MFNSLGEPFSIFPEIIISIFKTKQQKKKNCLMGNKKLLNEQLKKLKYNLILYEIKNIKMQKILLILLILTLIIIKRFSKLQINLKNMLKIALIKL